MQIDLLRELAPLAKTSSRLRADLTDYFRILVGNHADFRAEVFLHLLCELLDTLPEDQIERSLASLNKERFPELLAGSSKVIRERIAAEGLRRLHEVLESSRWMALGRVLGFVDGSLESQKPLSAELTSLEQRLRRSKWVRLGRALGLGPEL